MLVIGSNGFLGRHLATAFGATDLQLLMPPSTMLDVRDRARVVDEVTGWRPSAVVNLAYRRDDRRTIVDGGRNVAEAAATCGARLVHLSTDLVFGGRSHPYTEADRPDPVMPYGEMKARAEAAVLSACPTAVVIRTSLLYGTDLPAPWQTDVERAIDGTAPMTFFTDEVRCPAHATDVAAAIVRLLDLRHVHGPLHVAGSEAMSRATIAAAHARWAGVDAAALRTGAIAESGQRRPGRVVLDTAAAASLGLRCRPMSEWLRPRSS